MSLLRFGYLHRKRLLTLIAILVLASTLFSVTAYSFLGFYNGFTDYVGAEGDVIAVYSKTGSSPFSGMVPLSLADKIASLQGVEVISPEVIAPATIQGQAVFIRGAIPQEINKLNPPTVVQGKLLSANDTFSVIIGENLSHKLRLNAGDKMLVFGVLSNRYVELQIKGVFRSVSSLDDEAIVPLYIGQWLRDASYNQATLFRVKINPAQTSANQLYLQIANTTAPPSSASPVPTQKSAVQREIEALLPYSQTKIDLSQVGVDESQQFMQSYLSRYGVSRDAVLVLSVVVLVFASGTAACATGLFVRQHSSDIGTLLSIGVSDRRLKIDLAVRLTFWAAAATLIGTIISAAVITLFQRTGILQVLSHTFAFQLDPFVVAANFLLLSGLVCICVSRMELKP